MTRPSKSMAAAPGLEPGGVGGFTLMELLVVVSVIAILAGLLLPVLSKAKESARSIQCLSQMRQISLAVRLYADEHEDSFPRSQHSAFACGEKPWGRAIADQLGEQPASWTNLLSGVYQCPSDKRQIPWSYGQNVYFELSPESDDYAGSPRTWRRLASVPYPSNTILQAENASGVDHIMSHFWLAPSDAADVARTRHRQRANYAFVDGHAGAIEFALTYAPEKRVDAWNPFLAQSAARWRSW